MIQYLLPHNRRGLNDKLRIYFSHIGRMADQTWFSGGFSGKRRKEEVILPIGQKTDTIREVLWFILRSYQCFTTF
jgi:hypothetical protein